MHFYFKLNKGYVSVLKQNMGGFFLSVYYVIVKISKLRWFLQRKEERMK